MHESFCQQWLQSHMTDMETDPYKAPPTADALPPLPLRPGRVLVVGGLFCVTGGLVLCKILWELVHNRFSFDHHHLPFYLLVPMLPEGIGLLKGRANSKWSATLSLIICYGICSVFIVMELTIPGQVTEMGFLDEIEGGYPRAVFLSSAIVLGVVSIVTHCLLASQKSAEYFRQHRVLDLKDRIRSRRVRGG